MKIAIIGAGVVGITTAYTLAKLGHQVMVFDREPGPAMESSHANGGQLSFGFASPMATPGMLKKAPSIALGSDIGFRFPLRPSANFVVWASKFARRCLPRASASDARQLAAMAHHSGVAFSNLREDIEFDFSHRKAGKLAIFAKEKQLSKARSEAKREPLAQVLSKAECLEFEPSLQHYNGPIVGGVLNEDDEVGDAARFCGGLAEYSERQFGVRYFYNTEIDKLSIRNNRVVGIVGDDEESIRTDCVVCCSGTGGRELLGAAGIRLPIYPIYGYSLTAPAGLHAPERAITDSANKFVYSRIGDQVRIAGFADFGIPTKTRKVRRIEDLQNVAKRKIPNVARLDAISSTWVGARPATPNSLPIVGPTKIKGLHLNMGHGMFGWTLAAGTAQSIAEDLGTTSHQYIAA